MPKKRTLAIDTKGMAAPETTVPAAEASTGKTTAARTRRTAAATHVAAPRSRKAKTAEVVEQTMQQVSDSVTALAQAVGQPAAFPEKEIAELAYSYWLKRGRQHGSAVEDWLRAEREVLARLQN